MLVAVKKPGKGKSKALTNSTPKIKKPLSAYIFHIIMALVATVILAGGYLIYHFQEQQTLQRTESGLAVVAQSKADQVSEWRAARLVDANTLAGSPSFTDTVAAYMASPMDNEIRDKVIGDLAIVAQSYPYQDILLTDIEGNVLLSVNNSVRRLGDTAITQLPIAIKEHQAVFTDFHYPPDSDSPHLNVIAPVFPWRQDSPTAIGAVVLYIDPSRYLYPLMQSSPIPSQTGETLLVERDGDQALFLNELRHQQNTALKLRIPLSQQNAPAVMAVMGKEGVFEGTDYRGVEVLSATEHISDSPWYLVVKIDTSEALTPWRSRSGYIIASIAGLMAAALAFVGLIWQRRQRLVYQAMYQVEAGRKKLEQELINSETKYRRLFEAAQDSILILDGDTGQIIDANPFIKEMLGYTLEELRGKHLWEIGTFRDIVASKASFKELKKKGYIRYDHLPLQTKDGYQIHVEFVSNRYKVDGREVFQCNIRNITERKRAEDKLRDSEERFRALIENSQDAITLLASDGTVLYDSPSIVRILGYEPTERIGRSVFDFVHPSRRQDMADGFMKFTQQAGAVVRYVVPFLHKDGTLRWIEGMRSNLLHEPAIQAVVVNYRDITERKQAEEALERSEERYRTILEGMDDSYYEVDLAGNFTFVNDSLCRRLGHSREELIGMNYRAYTPKEHSDTTFKTFNRVYRTGEPVKGVPSAAIARDGSIILTERSVFPLRDDAGKIIGFRGISRDVTERRMAEKERSQLELKAQIASRLASVGEMAAGVAHEINNPLTAVTGYAQLLVEREDIPADIRSDLAAINDGAQRVAGIVQRLLAFSRQTKPQRKYVDINDLIESTLILRAYHLRVNDIEVVTRLYPGLLETVVDPGQIQQVILNLIVNAETEMKLAHDKGKLTITTEKRNNIIRISVRDNGPGIKSEVMDKIFNPFFTTREVGQGTGLGLSLCYGIIAEHKGKIYVESRPGKGATFIIELPVIEEFTAPEQSKMQFEPEKAVKARILAVDDEQVVRDVIKRVLTAEGHKVETADDAADALKKIEGKKYNLILVDIKMPGMNGVELFKRIRKIDESLAGRVVFITGDIMGADTERFLSETKVAHISKPFNAGQLKKRVMSTLNEAGRRKSTKQAI
jgi:PAS domain S-box-containing protein